MSSIGAAPYPEPMAAIHTVRDFGRRIGPRARDVTVILLGLGATLASVLSHPSWSPFGWPIVLVVGSGGSLALWWRRRRPVRVTVLGLGTFLLSANPVPMCIGLFTTAVARRDRTLVVLAGAGAVVFAIPDLVGGHANPGSLISGLLQAGFLVAAGSYIGARQDLLASLRDRAERAESEHELRAEQAKAGERARIAREMHDVLAHKVSLIALHAGALEVAPDADAATVEAAAALIRTTARQTLEELRQVLGVLRSDGAGLDGTDLAPQAQAADIARLVDASRAAGVPIDLQAEVPDLPDATARAVYRVVQEGLTNVHKHARGAATAVAVLGNERCGVTVRVANRRPVAAGSLLPGSGAGLVGLAERMRLLGGRLQSGPEPDGGWRLEAWVPWAPVSDAESSHPSTGGRRDPGPHRRRRSARAGGPADDPRVR